MTSGTLWSSWTTTRSPLGSCWSVCGKLRGEKMGSSGSWRPAQAARQTSTHSGSGGRTPISIAEAAGDVGGGKTGSVARGAVGWRGGHVGAAVGGDVGRGIGGDRHVEDH